MHPSEQIKRALGLMADLMDAREPLSAVFPVRLRGHEGKRGDPKATIGMRRCRIARVPGSLAVAFGGHDWTA